MTGSFQAHYAFEATKLEHAIRTFILILTAMGLAACTVRPLASPVSVDAQVSGDDIAREKLEVLEPFLGSWRLSGTNGNNIWQWDMSWSWAYPKTMLYGDATFRMSGPEMEDLFEPWARASMSWNPKSEAIEYTFLDLGTGFVDIYRMEPGGDAQFTQTLIRTTNPYAVNQNTLVSFIGSQMIMQHTQRKNRAGEALPDDTQTLEQID